MLPMAVALFVTVVSGVEFAITPAKQPRIRGVARQEVSEWLVTNQSMG